TLSMTGRARPAARCGTTERANACTAAAFSSIDRARSTVPITLARRPMSARAGSDDDDPPAQRERLEATRQVGGADELQDDIHAARLGEHARLGAHVRERLAARARVRERAGAGAHAAPHAVASG